MFTISMKESGLGFTFDEQSCIPPKSHPGNRMSIEFSRNIHFCPTGIVESRELVDPMFQEIRKLS